VPLALATDWDPITALTIGWAPIYNKAEKSELVGPALNFSSTSLSNIKGTAADIRFRLVWSSVPLNAGAFNRGTPPLAGLVAAGEGFDPGLFDVDTQTGAISALPRRNGNYTLFLLADDSTAGTATALGLPPQLDQVIVKRWDFIVVGKPDFAVSTYTREAAATLPPVGAGEDPYITTARVGSINCVVGTMYHIAPINASKASLVYSHASGGEGTKIRFTIRNPPPGFFIEPSTGEIQGNPQASSAGETFTSTLLAVDAGGQEAVLETITVTILSKPRFVPVFETTRTTVSEEDVEYTDPKPHAADAADRAFVVGTSYKIATFILNTTATKVSAGAVADITYTLSSDAPESFCVQAKSGDISGTFPTAGNYSFGVLAVDQAGATAVVERFHIVVEDRPVFTLAVGSSRVRNGSEFAEPLNGVFYVDESYRFSPLQLLQTGTVVSAGSFDDIVFTLTTADGWFVSAQTGEIFGQFGSVGNHTMTLYAVDFAGKQALVEEMRFVVQPRPMFGLDTIFDPSMLSPQDVGLESTVAAAIEPTATIQYAVGSTVKFPRLEQSASELFVNPAFDDFSKITYKQIFDTSANDGAAAPNSPGLWLVDTETGEMLAQPERAGNYAVSLTATDGRGAEVVVRKWAFEVLLRDIDVPEYGPNSSDCNHNGVRVDDAFIFDQKFACNCVGTGFLGANCEIPIEATKCDGDEALVGGACKPFQLATAEDGSRTATGAEFTDPTKMDNTRYYTVREFASYRIAPLAIDDARTNYSSGNQSDLTYTMSGNTDGFFLNTQTGQMLGTFDSFADDKSATQTYSITLQAVDASGVHQDLESLTMQVRYPDLEVDEYGPNEQMCQNNGTRMDGLDGLGDVFDQSYVCKCISTSRTAYSGDNCEIATTAPLASVAGDSSSAGTVAGGMAGAVIFLLFVGLILFKRREQAIKMQAFDFEAEIARLITAGEIDADDEAASRTPREVKRSHVTMTDMIGEGAFGEVWKAVLDETAAGGVPGYMVAVKTSKETKGEGAEEMLREATVMAQVSGHPNLVSLIGVVTSGPPLLLLLSLCENGSLLSLLKKRKQKGVNGIMPLTVGERLKMALDTARGMEHLTANKFVHRDLAARNVLVDVLMCCKVADFGLARGTAGARTGPETNEDGDEEEYYRSRTGTFPVRWTAPEAMQTMRFTEGSDAWSFGITMIEVFTDGGKPYATMDNAAVISEVQGGYRAPQPELCPDTMYAVMLECWHAKAAERPPFTHLAERIETLIIVLSPTELSAQVGGDQSRSAEPTVTISTYNMASDSLVGESSVSASARASASASTPRSSGAVSNATYTSSIEPATSRVGTIAETSVDAAAGDAEYLSVTVGLVGAAEAVEPLIIEGGGEGQYLNVSQQLISGRDAVEEYEC
jgi:serine/threonine protein kinase